MEEKNGKNCLCVEINQNHHHVSIWTLNESTSLHDSMRKKQTIHKLYLIIIYNFPKTTWKTRDARKNETKQKQTNH